MPVFIILASNKMRLLPVQLGLTVVAGTHIWMLSEGVPEVQRNHALVNLAAAAVIYYGLFM